MKRFICFSQFNALLSSADYDDVTHTSCPAATPLFRRSNSVYRQWLAEAGKTFHDRAWLKQNSFKTVFFQFRFSFISIVRTVLRKTSMSLVQIVGAGSSSAGKNEHQVRRPQSWWAASHSADPSLWQPVLRRPTGRPRRPWWRRWNDAVQRPQRQTPTDHPRREFCPFFVLPSPLLPLSLFNEGLGYHPRENFGIRWVSEHFIHKYKLIPSPNLLIFVPQGLPWRILRRRECLWTPLTVCICCLWAVVVPQRSQESVGSEASGATSASHTWSVWTGSLYAVAVVRCGSRRWLAGSGPGHQGARWCHLRLPAEDRRPLRPHQELRGRTTPLVELIGWTFKTYLSLAKQCRLDINSTSHCPGSVALERCRAKFHAQTLLRSIYVVVALHRYIHICCWHCIFRCFFFVCNSVVIIFVRLLLPYGR